MSPEDERDGALWRACLALAWDEIHAIEWRAGLNPSWTEVEGSASAPVRWRTLWWTVDGPVAGPWTMDIEAAKYASTLPPGVRFADPTRLPAWAY